MHGGGCMGVACTQLEDIGCLLSASFSSFFSLRSLCTFHFLTASRDSIWPIGGLVGSQRPIRRCVVGRAAILGEH